MSYDVHITRAAEFYESDNHPISLSEWQTIIQADPELEARTEITMTTPSGDTLSMSGGPGLAVWRFDGLDYYLIYRDSHISTRYSDDVIDKLKELAARLDARVIGDEGEEY
ncbi:hypothetical protein EV586_10216 [Tumebacillus sp. BK434]|uniref:hypothetical protein n=1 Tax=Tumebacillus sp. BK434 TaxID=2512169 RepID=UPI0010451D8C|nr:hypothetical protein [Tumebacillus sp. BK434]TCP57575.1 hypothetical protein EV586_10216 [Tumebacillus sp. BK434]